uniref:Tyrosine-protein phosphatase domain-containing protein n=1 Tax=Elaeophora elaphi TaxID=1147741 RepID=A0A0R3RPN3_9BILA
MLSKGVKGLNDEFIALCLFNFPSFPAYKKFCSGRNRYRNVVCLDHSRVKLNNHPTRNDYIHANYVSTPFSERRFICTQAPLDCTTFDFWFMIIQEKVRYIIMLTNFTEKGYTKSTLYFPFEANKTENYNGITVKCITVCLKFEILVSMNFIQQLNTLTLFISRSLVIEWPGVQSMLVTHLHWIDWPDHGIPNSYACPLLLLKMVRISSTPIVLHCSAGIGRTGCLVLIELVLEKLLCKQICSDMSLMLIELRRQRANLVQNNIVLLFLINIFKVFLKHFLFFEIKTEKKKTS